MCVFYHNQRDNSDKMMIQSQAEKASQFRKGLFDCLDKRDTATFKKIAGSLNPEVVVLARDEREGFEGKTLLHQAAR